MIKVILNNKRIFLAEDYRDLLKEYNLTNAHLCFQPDRHKVTNVVDVLLISDIQDAIIIGQPENSLALMKQAFRPVTAGGGVVFNNRNELLFIYRRKKWDLPKGKINRGESIEQCASREVREETGLRDLEVVRPLYKTYHIYLESGVMLKETHWFLMYSEQTRLFPQKDEGISKVVWVHKNNIQYQLRNTYPAIEEIFDRLLKEEA